jgi:3-dehydroquinate synthase
VEALGGYRLYRHGEAVAIGMVSAALIAERLGVAEKPVSGPTVAVLEAFGHPTRPKRPDDPDALLAAMLKDKKTTEGVLNFVLPRRIGEVVNRPVPAGVVLDVVRSQGVSGGGRER